VTDAAFTPAPDDRPILVTGSCGLVGTAVLHELGARGLPAVAAARGKKSDRKLLAALGRRYPVAPVPAWADLTDRDAVRAMIAQHRPRAVIHLAAVIPPAAYASPGAARRVNVDATHHLLDACRAVPETPRFLLASSVTVYGPRNPHTHPDHVTVDTPPAPSDLYGAHKLEAEAAVRDSGLDASILRVGGVLSPAGDYGVDADVIAFEGMLPGDGRIHTVAVADVARAFVNAALRPDNDPVYLIGGDATHLIRQRDIGRAITAALSIPGTMPPTRPGDPGDDAAWYGTDWMDTARSQQLLQFQTVSFDELMAQVSAHVGWPRHLLRPLVPAIRLFMNRMTPYRRRSGVYAQPWEFAQERWEQPLPDRR